MKRLGKILNYALTTLLVLIIVAAAFLAFAGRRSADRIPTVAGNKVLNVLSGSMEPKIHTGDVIIVRPLPAGQNPKEGDVITYKAVKGSEFAADMLITHRVLGVVSVNDKPTAWVTKGDANQSPDSAPVPREAIVGVYSWRIPYFGYVSYFLHKPLGVILLLVVPGVILIAEEIRKIYKIMVEEEVAKARALAAQATEAGPAGGEPSPK